MDCNDLDLDFNLISGFIWIFIGKFGFIVQCAVSIVPGRCGLLLLCPDLTGSFLASLHWPCPDTGQCAPRS